MPLPPVVTDRCHWAVIPAAGVGRRMGAGIPKQYRQLAGQPLILHALTTLANHPAIDGVMVALSPGDPYWPALAQGLQLQAEIRTVDGGTERAESVLNAIRALGAGGVADECWLLVHDAARPLLDRADIDRLLSTLDRHPVGGILAAPVRDTMKRADERGGIAATVPRDRLWHALTPQMFRLGVLRDALEAALAAGVEVTDDASAIEWRGLVPLLVEGRSDNLKVTREEDLLTATRLLANREEVR